MLTKEQIQANKERFKQILGKVATLNPGRQKQTNNILDWLEKSDFYVSPASTKYHQSYEGGLCEHSLQVYDHLIKLTQNYNITDIPEESIILVSLLHDLCKVDMYRKHLNGHYLKDEYGADILKNGKKQWVEEEGYIINPNNKLHIGHAEKSLFIVTQFYQLSGPEYEAILYHMGYCDIGNYRNMNETSMAFEENTLAFLLHTADMLSTYLQRKG